jgi:hypothetical protein
MQMANNYKHQGVATSCKMLDPNSDTTHATKVSERDKMFGGMVQKSHASPTKDFVVLLAEN